MSDTATIAPVPGPVPAPAPGPAAPPADDGSAPVPSAEQAGLEALQQENQRLRRRIEQLEAERAEPARGDRLDQAEQDNRRLRDRFAALALSQALAQAATRVGLSEQAAGVYAHRFRCTIDAEGQPRIEPNPTEFLLRQVQDNPLLRHSVQREASQRQARAVANGACPIDQADPVELLSALDRDPARKAQFISRHGSAAFIDLAAKARAKGYRTL